MTGKNMRFEVQSRTENLRKQAQETNSVAACCSEELRGKLFKCHLIKVLFYLCTKYSVVTEVINQV